MSYVIVLNARMDSRAWEREVDRFAAATGVKLQRAVRQETRAVIKLLYEFTAPNSQAQGENAVARDISRIFTARSREYLEMVTDHFGSRQVRQVLRNKHGQPYLIEADIIDLSGAGMADFHRRKRISRGRVSQAGERTRNIGRWVADDTMWVTHDAFSGYLRTVQSRVGLSKSGWLPAMDALGLSAESYVTRHRGAGGSVRNNLSDPKNPRMVVENNLGLLSNAAAQDRLVERVLQTRRNILEERIKALLQE